MRIFLYEHVTGGGWAGEPLPASLAAEGRAMHESLLGDLTRVTGVAVVTTRDARLEPPLEPAADILRVASRAGAERLFDTLAREADGVLLIAPELEGELARRAHRVEALGGRLLGSSPGAIELAADKLLLGERLAAAGVRGLRAAPFTGKEEAARLAFPAVVKPRRGAGSTGVQLVAAAGDAALLDLTATPEWIATPFTPGVAASVLLLLGARARLALAPCRQLLSTDGRFRYLGGELPLSPPLAARAARLALRAAGAVPGLRGFAGVDLILGAAGDGADDAVVEINARPTTSYAGLRVLARDNLAAAWLGAGRGEEPPAPRWRPARIRFRPDGAWEEIHGS